jgi:hypothetical protein
MAGFAELTIEQGANYSTSVTVNGSDGAPTNLTGYSAAAQLRKSYYSTTATNFTVAISSPSTGELTLSLLPAATTDLTPGRYVYDLLITSPLGVKTRVVEGIAVILPSVTR